LAPLGRKEHKAPKASQGLREFKAQQARRLRKASKVFAGPDGSHRAC
jgi:hypothetical protein